MKKAIWPLVLFLFGILAPGQTTHNRIPVDSVSNVAVITVNGATPSIVKGSVFKTGNGTATTITNFTGAAYPRHITLICGDSNTSIQSNSNILTSSGSKISCAPEQAYEFEYATAQSKWVQTNVPQVGGRAQANPVNRLTTQQNVAGNLSHRGPNPTVDVTAAPFYARPINPNMIPGGAVSVSASSRVAMFTSGGNRFQTNDGIAIPGAGATQLMTTPSAPTVTPSTAASSTGTGFTVAGAKGSMNYSYKIVAVDIARGMTAASMAGATTRGNPSLGAHSDIKVASATNSNGTVTWTVNSTANLSVGTFFRVGGTTDDGEFGGFFRVASVVDGTHFTSLSGMDSRAGMSSTTVTGGTIDYWICNHLVLPEPKDGKTMQYLIYGRTSGSYTLLHVTYPINQLLTFDATYLTWDDYGSTMTPTLANPPWWAPATPPSSAQNDMLVTTIIAGGGSSTPTLATAAVNSVTSINSHFDDGPAILAAKNASYCHATGCGGTIYIPPFVENADTGASCYLTSSYLNLDSAPVNLAGTLCVGDTIQTSGTWTGMPQAAIRHTQGQFNFLAYPTISIRQSGPGFWCVSGCSFNYLTLNDNAANDYYAIWHDGSTNGAAPPQEILMNRVNLNGGGTSDYMGVLYYNYSIRLSAWGFGGVFRDVSFVSGPGQEEGSTSTPLFIAKGNTEWNFDYISGGRRGFYFTDLGVLNFFMGEEWQGGITPLITLNSDTGGVNSGNVSIKSAILDTEADPLLVVHGTNGTTGVSVRIEGGNQPASGMPLVSGTPINALELDQITNGSQQNIGQNVNLVNIAPNAFGFAAQFQSPQVYIPRSINQPNANYGCTLFDLSSDNWVSWDCNSSPRKYFAAGLPSTVPWTSGQFLQAASRANVYTLSTIGGTPCRSGASPAVCGSATSGQVQVPAAATTLVINTTAVAANSRFSFTYVAAGGGCSPAPVNIASLLPPYVSGITAGTSFTITLPVAPTTNPACISFMVIN